MNHSSRGSRRILSLYVPQILSEIVHASRCSLLPQKAQKNLPLGIVVVENIEADPRPNEKLTAVCPQAAKLGVRAGHTLTEASALAANLRIELVEEQLIEEQLIAVAEAIKAYGTTVSWVLPDTIYLDVSGVAHLFGGEQSLADEIQERVRLLGHVVRAAIASGPMIAEAVARTTPGRAKVVKEEESKEALQDLPLSALPLNQERLSWFTRLGILTIGQLSSLPPKSTSSRLGPQASKIHLLMEGIDENPLTPGVFPEILSESIEWDEPVLGVSPLTFALHGLVFRLHTRLSGRGEACSHLELSLQHDQAIARHRGVLSQSVIAFELSSPLYQEADFERILKIRLERLKLEAPTIGISLKASQLSPQVMNQLSLDSHHASSSTQRKEALSAKVGAAQNHDLSILLAELQPDLQKEEVGILALSSSHRPEALSTLIPILAPRDRKAHKLCPQGIPPALERITRLLPEPCFFNVPLKKDECLTLGDRLYHVEKTMFLQRIDRVEWWSPRAVSRDYYWVWLKGQLASVEALFFIERRSKKLYLQGFRD